MDYADPTKKKTLVVNYQGKLRSTSLLISVWTGLEDPASVSESRKLSISSKCIRLSQKMHECYMSCVYIGDRIRLVICLLIIEVSVASDKVLSYY